jgi:hypothetical protein
MRLLENILYARQRFLNGGSRFKAGRVSIEDDERSGRPSTSKTTEDRRRIIHELADTVGISYGVCQEILTENFNMRRIAAKFVPRLLTND